MDKKETAKYIFLILGVLVFFVLIFSFSNNSSDQEAQLDTQTAQTTEEQEGESVSEIFENNIDFDEEDPFSEECSGKEGAITSFTICSGD